MLIFKKDFAEAVQNYPLWQKINRLSNKGIIWQKSENFKVYRIRIHLVKSVRWCRKPTFSFFYLVLPTCFFFLLSCGKGKTQEPSFYQRFIVVRHLGEKYVRLKAVCIYLCLCAYVKVWTPAKGNCTLAKILWPKLAIFYLSQRTN